MKKGSRYFLCSQFPFVAMMQTADPGELNQVATLSRFRLDRTSRWCVLYKSIMGSIFMIILKVTAQNPFQMAFVEHDQMIKAIPAN